MINFISLILVLEGELLRKRPFQKFLYKEHYEYIKSYFKLNTKEARQNSFLLNLDNIEFKDIAFLKNRRYKIIQDIAINKERSRFYPLRYRLIKKLPPKVQWHYIKYIYRENHD